MNVSSFVCSLEKNEKTKQQQTLTNPLHVHSQKTEGENTTSY